MPRTSVTDRSELSWIVGLALLLLAFFLGLFVVRGFRFPVGPDGPVYLWWTRLAGHDGLSAVDRPGVPAIVLTLSGTLHISIVAASAGLQCALGVAVGLAGAAVMRAWAPGERFTWWIGGALTGSFAVHLVSGYLANLALAAAFLAAAVALAQGTRRGTIAAAAMLASGGFSHPQFFFVGLAILGVSAALAWRSGEPGAASEAVRTLTAMVQAGAMVGIGFLALLVGPGALHVDTSRDAFLRRVGSSDTLRSLYRDRFVHRAARYVEWVSVPLASLGVPKVRGCVGRLLSAWGIVTIAGVAFGLATALLPPDRFITFGYVVPLLAAVGAMRLWRALAPRRVLATAIVSVLIVLMALGTLFSWRREKPFLSAEQVASVTTATRWIRAVPPGTPLGFEIDTGDPTITFFATQAANIIRASVPPGRIRDVYIVVPSSSAPPGSERGLLERQTDAQLRALHRIPVRFTLAPFDAPAFLTLSSRDREVVAPGVRVVNPGLVGGLAPAPGPPASDPLRPSSPAGIAFATIGGLALLGAVGYGWGRAAGLDRKAAAMLSPAVGSAAIVLVALVLDRIGAPLSGSIGPTVVSALAGGGGYFAVFGKGVGERRVTA